MAAITGLLADIRAEQPPPERFDLRATDLPRMGNPYRRLDERSSA